MKKHYATSRVPHVPQAGEKDCGPACWTMIDGWAKGVHPGGVTSVKGWNARIGLPPARMVAALRRMKGQVAVPKSCLHPPKDGSPRSDIEKVCDDAGKSQATAWLLLQPSWIEIENEAAICNVGHYVLITNPRRMDPSISGVGRAFPTQAQERATVVVVNDPSVDGPYLAALDAVLGQGVRAWFELERTTAG